jgi:hypothetical protein
MTNAIPAARTRLASEWKSGCDMARPKCGTGTGSPSAEGKDVSKLVADVTAAVNRRDVLAKRLNGVVIDLWWLLKGLH